MGAPDLLPKLSPLVDVVFRRLFEDPALLQSLLNALLRLSGSEQIASLALLPPQVSGPLADDKEVLLDLRATCQSGRQFHIEVQVRAFASYPERMLFYWAGMYHGQLEAGQGYGELSPVLSLHILGFRLLPEGERFADYHHVFELRERTTQHRLTDHLRLHTIEMPKFVPAGHLASEEEMWLYFLQHGHEMTLEQVAALGVATIARAEEQLRVISQDRILRVQYEQRMKAERDAVAWEKDKIASWLDEGKRLGLDEGKRLGLDEGKRLGLDEGKRLGLDEGKRLGLDEGKRLGLLSSIEDLCDLLGIAVTPERREDLARRDLEGLAHLRGHLKAHRAWPG